MSSTRIQDLDRLLQGKEHIGIFLLRLFVSLRLLYGVVDNVFSWERMIEFSHFLASFGFPAPVASAVLSVYVQFIGGVFLLIGYRIRSASFVLAMNFVVALIFVHFASGDSVEAMTPPLAMLFGCLTFIFTGPGKLSVEHRLSGRLSNP